VNNSYIIIPARSGSKGVLNKNLRKIHGVNLTIRSLVHAMQIAKKNNIVLSTNSYEVIESVSDYFKIKRPKIKINELIDFGEFSLHFRSEHLSSDQSLITDVMSNIYELLISAGGSPSIFCLLQPTTPFRSQKELESIKTLLYSDVTPNFSLTSVTLVESFHPARMYRMLEEGQLAELEGFSDERASRRQDLSPIYIRDGGFYLIGGDLIRRGQQYTNNPVSIIRIYPWNINIDSEQDLLIANSVEIDSVLADPNSGLTW
jgi:CMP-N,N'-diacetyllegionaminic acid synthase